MRQKQRLNAIDRFQDYLVVDKMNPAVKLHILPAEVRATTYWFTVGVRRLTSRLGQ